MIYAIGDGNKVKIGYSKNPRRRLRQLQTGHPNKLKLLHTWEGDKLAEKRIHYILKPLILRHNSEWFKISLNDLGIIDEILAKV